MMHHQHHHHDLLLLLLQGSHIYEFGDHGGIIVMANDEKEVTEIQYSWNEGMTWETLHFSCA